MELDRISIRLRQRGGFESVDLGVRMAMQWWRPLWTVWLVTYLPIAAILAWIFHDNDFLLVLALYWFKPVPERFALHVLSRAVFGEQVSAWAAVRAWREVLTPGLLAQLTWRRPFDWMRSFNTPVMQLERQTGREAADRRRTLGQRFGSYAVALQFIGFLFEFALQVGASMFLYLFLATEGSELASTEEMWHWSDTALLAASFCAIGPVFVASGFSLYLNRRIILEAWDVELNLKRLRARIEAIGAGALGLLLACLVGVFAPVAPGHAARGATPEVESAAAPRTPAPQKTPMREAAVAVVSAPEFGSEKAEQDWRLRFRQERKRDSGGDFDLFSSVGEFLARVLQVLGWMLIAGIVGGLAWLIWRTFGGYTPDTPIGRQAPKVLFGLNIAPETLPDDIGNAALALIEAGHVREALSLIYRGALSYLVHARNLRVSAGATESEVATLSRRVLTPAGAEYFGSVLTQWIDIAYAGRLPDVAVITLLARRYREFFAAAPGGQERAP